MLASYVEQKLHIKDSISHREQNLEVENEYLKNEIIKLKIYIEELKKDKENTSRLLRIYTSNRDYD